MKKYLAFFIALLLAVAVLTQFVYAPCATPTKYKIGDIDARFNKTTEELAPELMQASKIWGVYEGHELFAFDPKADLTVNLVYDERQGLVNQMNSLDEQLKSEKQSLDPEVANYRARVAEFETRLKNFNDKVSYWNTQGGAPPSEYENLKKEQTDLQAEADSLNEMGRRLNQTSQNYNTHVGEFNQTLHTYENALDLKPEQGLYDGEANTIDIYFLTNEKEFIHTLAHELGHARGIDHVNDKTSIMFPYSSEITDPSPQDLQALKVVCTKHSYMDIAISRWAKTYFIIKNLISAKLNAKP